MSTTYKTLKPEEITVDQRLQVRKALDEPTVEKYKDLYIERGHFMPITVGQVQGTGPIYLVDGFHRHAAVSQLPGRSLDCFVKAFDSFDDMFEEALKANMQHGLSLTEEERRDGILKVIQRHPEESQRQLADRCGCGRTTIQRYQNQLAQVGQFERPETVKGKDGKVRPTTVTRKYEKPAIIAPPEPVEEDFEEPADDQTPADAASVTPAEGAEVQKPNSPAHFCAGGCGTPIWDEMKDAPDSTYIHKGTKWFCSEECCRNCDTEEEASEDEPERPVIGTPTPEDLYMRHCWNAGAKREADEDKDEDLDDDEDGPCERCGDYIFDQPDPSTLDPAALPVPRCPFDEKHRPRLGKVSNNGYDVRCRECRTEGRRVDTFVEKSWKKAYAAWGCYDGVEAATLEELLEKADF